MVQERGAIMASIFKRPGGQWTVEVYLTSNKKTKIGLATKSQREARRVADHIQILVDSKKSGISNIESAAWLHKIETESPKLFQRLVNIGLAEKKNENQKKTVGMLTQHYISHCTGVFKTVEKYVSAAKNLVDYFGEEFPLESLTHEKALDFMAWMRTPEANRKSNVEYAVATVSRRLVNFKTFFRYAIKLGWASENPFLEITGGPQVNRDRWQYVPKETIAEILQKTPNPKWSAIIALGRFGGFRGASELHGLRWSDIRFPTPEDPIGTIQIHAEKLLNKKYEYRTIPMCEILCKSLMIWREKQTPKSEYLFPGMKEFTNTNTVIRKIIKAAKIPLWEEPWYNLRRSFCSDIMESGVDAKIYESITGHSWTVGMQHYQILHADRQRRGHEKIIEVLGISGDKTGDITQQIPPKKT